MGGFGKEIAGIVMVSTVLFIMLAGNGSANTPKVIDALSGAFSNSVAALQGRSTSSGVQAPSVGN